MSGRDKNLSTKQAHAISLLLLGASYEQAADGAGTSVRTLRRWRNTPEFRESIREGEAAIVSFATRKAYGLVDEALEVLARVMRARDTGDSARVRAAIAVIDAALRLRDAVEIETRLRELEAKINTEENHE